MGYKIYNFSPFDLTGNPKLTKSAFLPESKALVTSQTFTSRFWKDLWFNFASSQEIQNFLNLTLSYNLKKEIHTRNLVMKKGGSPKFVYTHLVMPHFPYYFDSIGNKTKLASTIDENRENKNSYTSYLK
ncbi:MAG: hypothetical protein IPO53_02340 [Chitinophagaceae bacterium]|nr:hypothetical protein [Chitinophagaceae bacterium]